MSNQACPHDEILPSRSRPSRRLESRQPSRRRSLRFLAAAPRAWVKQVNAIISGFNSDPRVTYLYFGDEYLARDGSLPKAIMPDALHPNLQGYEIWADAITPIVKRYFPGQLGPAPGTPSAAAAASHAPPAAR